jgi:NADH dehydrogenase
MAEVVSIDPTTRTATCEDGTTYSGDYLVLAMGTRPNFFHTPGAEACALPLYSLSDAEKLRSRIFGAFEDADRNPEHLDKGVLNFVIVGAGATGVETAGALADLINEIMPSRYHDLAVNAARVYVVDPAPVVLGPFSKKAHEYAAKALQSEGVVLKLGLSVTTVSPDKVVLSDGSEILTRTVVWGGGIQAAELASHSGVPQGRGGRLTIKPDLTVDGFPGVYAIGDVAATVAPDGTLFPQLGSVALQAGQWAAKNILADIDGEPRTGFHYHDKGIMAMIGRNKAIAEMGEHHHELHGSIAFAAWLGVHAWLMTGIRQRVDAFMSWGWDYFSHSRGPSVIDLPDAAKIEWGDDDDPPLTVADNPVPAT